MGKWLAWLYPKVAYKIPAPLMITYSLNIFLECFLAQSSTQNNKELNWFTKVKMFS